MKHLSLIHISTENYALQENKLAREVTDTNKAMFLDQVKALNISFDYERVIAVSYTHLDVYKRQDHLLSP